MHFSKLINVKILEAFSMFCEDYLVKWTMHLVNETTLYVGSAGMTKVLF
jgi:hypothetical protein